MSRLDCSRKQFQERRTETSRKCAGRAMVFRGVMCGRALGRDIVVYKVVIQGIQVLSASPMDH